MAFLTSVNLLQHFHSSCEFVVRNTHFAIQKAFQYPLDDFRYHHVGAIFLACQVYEFTHFVHAQNELTLSTYRGEPHVFGSTLRAHGTRHSVAIGVLVTRMVRLFLLGKMSTAHAIGVECWALLAFVDIVWIIIFPVVYLMEYAM